MPEQNDSSDWILRQALEANGQRFTEQRAAVYRKPGPQVLDLQNRDVSRFRRITFVISEHLSGNR